MRPCLSAALGLVAAACGEAALPGGAADLGGAARTIACAEGGGLQAGAPWPMTGRCPDHAGRSPLSGPRSPRVAWVFPTDGWMESSPAVAADGTVYVGSGDRHLYAIDGATGAARWSLALEAPVGSVAIGADGTVFAGEYTTAGPSFVHAVDGRSGMKRWRYPVFEAFGPTVDARGRVYLCNAGEIDVFAGGNGDEKGRYAIHGGLTLDPLLVPGGAVVGASTVAVVALSIASGGILWSLSTGGHVVYSSPAAAADGTIYIGATDGTLFAIRADGTLRWSFAAGARIAAAPAIGGDATVYLASGDRVLALDAATGGARWDVRVGGTATSVIVDGDGIVYAGARDGTLYAIDGRRGAMVWALRVGGPLSSRPAIGAGGTLYIGSDDHNLYAVRD